MKLIYIKKTDTYIDLDSKFYPNDQYTDEDLDFFLRLESEHKKSLQTHSLPQLLEMFPTAKAAAKRGLQEKVKQTKDKIAQLSDYRKTWTESYIDKLDDMSDQQSAREFLEKEIAERLDQYEREIKIYRAQIAYISSESKKDKAIKILRSKKKSQDEKNKAIKQMQAYRAEKKSRIDAEKIARAKETPIKDFIKVRGDNNAECLFHVERPGHRYKMHIYNNKYKCFSCGEHGTVIDIVMRLYNLSFVEAVKKLTTQ